MAGTSIRNHAFALALGCGLYLGAVPAERLHAYASAQVPEAEVFARVADRTIYMHEYQAALSAGVRQKFYHGRPQEGELATFSREVGEKLIMQVLLEKEAGRRGIEADRAAIDKQVAEYERRYAANEQWQRARENVLPRLTGELERRSRLERLEASVRAVPTPETEDARAYYAANPRLFTEPEKVRLSLILLRVEPAATASTWEEATALANLLHGQIAKGAEFAELARLHSADPSATKGGDLGYLHRGMLPEAIEKQFLDDLQIGAVAQPARVLEGIAIVRLDARQPARLRDFDEVGKNARELLQRERGEQAWTGLNARLRAGATVKVDESRYAVSGKH